MTLPPKDYKTWGELVVYARERARLSAARNGHQETAYWVRIMRWAQEKGRSDFPPRTAFCYAVDSVHRLRRLEDRAEAYAQAVHCRRMLINRGERVERLSLDWLRQEAERL